MRDVEKLRNDIEEKIRQAKVRRALDRKLIDPSVLTRKDLGVERREQVYEGADSYDIQKSLNRVDYEPLEREKEVRSYIDNFQLMVSRLKLWLYKKHVLKNPERFKIPHWLAPYIQEHLNLINPAGAVTIYNGDYEVAEGLQPKSHTLVEGMGTSTNLFPTGDNIVWKIVAPKTRIVLKHFALSDNELDPVQTTKEMIQLDNAVDVISLSSFENLIMYYPANAIATTQTVGNIDNSILGCTFNRVYANEYRVQAFKFLSQFDCRYIDMFCNQKTSGAGRGFSFQESDDSGGELLALTALGKTGTAESGIVFDGCSDMLGTALISDTFKNAYEFIKTTDDINLGQVEARSADEDGIYAHHTGGTITISGLTILDNKHYGIRHTDPNSRIIVLGGKADGNLLGDYSPADPQPLQPLDILLINEHFVTPLLCKDVIKGAWLGESPHPSQPCDAFMVGNDLYLVDINEDGACSIQGNLDRDKAKIWFGNVLDTNLYKKSAGWLKTNGKFEATELIGELNPNSLKIGGTEVISSARVLHDVTADAGIITSGAFDPARIPWTEIPYGIALGADTNLYRLSADVIKTDDDLEHAYGKGTIVADTVTGTRYRIIVVSGTLTIVAI